MISSGLVIALFAFVGECSRLAIDAVAYCDGEDGIRSEDDTLSVAVGVGSRECQHAEERVDI